MITLVAQCVHVALPLRLNFFLKKMEEPLLVFASLWFDIDAITFWLPSEKYKIVL
jgi:hypothetical protein